jgi:integrase
VCPCYKRKLSKGERWYYRGSYLSVKYHSQAIYHSKQEARKAEREELKKIDQNARRTVNDISLSDLCTARLDYLKLKKSKDYHTENRRYLNILMKELGEIKTTKVTKEMVNKVVMKEATRLQKAGKGNYKVNAMIRVLKALFNYGIRLYDLEMKNPCLFLEFYSVNISLKYIPKDDEVQAVRALLAPYQQRLFDFVEETGCRIMEAVRFTYEDIDGELITLWTRKARNSNLTPRRIPKPDCLAGKEGKGRVFADWTSHPRFLEDATAKVGTSWNWHNLRHRRATIWANSGMTLIEIMHRCGHSNIQTSQRYMQLLGFTTL